MSKSILVVEDDPGMREVLEGLLEVEGYAVRLARDGVEGLDQVMTGRPDLIVLDLMLPRMDGFAFATELSRLGVRPRVPILVLTADGRAPEKAARLGADGYLSKPFEAEELFDKVSGLLAR